MRSVLAKCWKRKWILAAGIGMGLSGALCAAESTSEISGSPPVAESSATQLQRVKAMRLDAKKIRDQAGRTREKDDYDCKKNAFLVNSCLANSRDRYTESITPARQLEIDANELEEKAKTRQLQERPANTPTPTAKPLDASAPHSSPGPTGRTVKPGESTAPKPTAKPINPAEQAAHEQQKQAERAKEAQQAAQRAKKAEQDKAQYEKRAQEAAQRKAKRAQKQTEKNGHQSTPVATP